MAAITEFFEPVSASGRMRPFDVRRDLVQVADLVEQCFADTLDPDGQHYLGQMRAAAANPAYVRWAGAAADRVSLPLSGYVWEENHRIVGNLTLIPFNTRGKKVYLIANVAVQAAYRRRGIARTLTARAIDHARQRNADSVWLHVREENHGAVKLYQDLGFDERARRTTWHGNPLSNPTDAAERIKSMNRRDITIVPRHANHWPAQEAWLNRLYPSDLVWHLALNPPTLRPGFMGGLYRFLIDAHVRQWSALRDGRLAGVLALHSTYTYADNLWLATSPEDDGEAALALLQHARRQVSPRRPLAIDYPGGQAVDVLQSAGFTPHQTLIWMVIPFYSSDRSR
jgi:ribosomal protein S18 acetylase RimI-like enzyme